MDLSEDIVIRRPVSEQALQISGFFRRMMVEVFSKSFPAEAVNHYCRVFGEVGVREDAVNNSKVFLVALNRGQIVGLIAGSTPNGGVASVVWLMVDPAYQGRGLGRRMMEYAFAGYRDMGAHKCIVYTETEDGRDFYAKIGMTLEGEHPDHWWSRRHYCLSKSLR